MLDACGSEKAEFVELGAYGMTRRAKQTFTEKLTSETCQTPGDPRGSPQDACCSADSRSSAARGSGPFFGQGRVHPPALSALAH